MYMLICIKYKDSSEVVEMKYFLFRSVSIAMFEFSLRTQKFVEVTKTYINQWLETDLFQYDFI